MCVKLPPRDLNPGPYSSQVFILVKWPPHRGCAVNYICTLTYEKIGQLLWYFQWFIGFGGNKTFLNLNVSCKIDLKFNIQHMLKLTCLTHLICRIEITKFSMTAPFLDVGGTMI